MTQGYDPYAEQLAAQARQDMAASDQARADIAASANAVPPPPPAAPPPTKASELETAAPAPPPNAGPADGPAAPTFKVVAAGQQGASPGGEVTTIGPTATNLLKNDFQSADQYASGEETRAFNRALNMNEAAREVGNARTAVAGIDQAAAERHQREAQQYDQHIADIKKASDELANTKIDPDRYWNNKSTGAKIALGISAVLSGFAAGLQGRGDNPTLNMIQSNIDRDVAAQRANYEAKAKSVDAKRSLYGMLVEKTGSLDKADAALRDSHWQQAEGMVKAAELNSKSQDAIGKAAELRRQIDAERTKTLLSTVKKVPASAGKNVHVVELTPGDPNSRVTMDDKAFTDYAQKQQELGIKVQEIAGKQQEGASKDLKWRAEQYRIAGLPEQLANMAASEATRSAAGTNGIGPVASRIAEEYPLVYQKLYGDAAMKREQAWAGTKNQLLKAMMGNVTEGEFTRAKAQFDNAMTPEARDAAMANARRIMAGTKRNIDSGVPELAAPAMAGAEERKLPPGVTRR